MKRARRLAALLLITVLLFGTTGITAMAAPTTPASVENWGNLQSLAGKKVSILGDSISTYYGSMKPYYGFQYPYADVQDINRTWWMSVINTAEMQFLANASSSASGVCGNSFDSTGNCGVSFTRLLDLIGPDGSVPDVIFVELGCNDMAASTPIGTYRRGQACPPEGNIGVFSQGYDSMLTKLQALYPAAKIVCLTCLPRTDLTAVGSIAHKNNNGHTVAEYNNMIKQVAAGHGVQVIDIWSLSGLNDANMYQFAMDGIHPTYVGSFLMAECVLRYLR